MKPKTSHRRFLTLSAIVLAGYALATPTLQAADLTHNLSSTLTLTGAVSYDSVMVGHNAGSSATIVDASGTDSFTSNGTLVYVGVKGVGTLKLGASNSITATTKLVMGGNEPDDDSGSNRSGTVTTASDSTTTITTPYMAVGTSKGTGTFTLGSSATLYLGTSESRTQLLISRSDTGNGYNRPANGTMNLSGGVADLQLSSLVIGRKTVGGNSENTYTGAGTLTLGNSGSNILDIQGAGNVVAIGYSDQNNMGPQGTLTIGNLNASSVIESTDGGAAILLGYNSGTVGSPVTTGTLDMKAGALTIKTTGAAITTGGSGGVSRLYLGETGNVTLKAGASSTDWIHGLTTAEIKSNGLNIDTAGFDLGVSQAFSGAGGLTKDGAGTLTLDGTSSYNGATLVSAGTLFVSGALSNSNVTVGANGTIGGGGTLGGTLHFNSGADFAFNVGQTLTVNGASVTFGNFGVANLFGLDNTVGFGTYTLIDGSASINFANVANVGSANAYNLGGGVQAYFQSGSLQLVVEAIPEPAAALLGGMGALLLLRRRRSA